MSVTLTLDQFFEELAKLPRQYDCFGNRGSGAIRMYRRGVNNCYCPLTAVASSVLGEEYSVGDMLDAGCALGLSREDARSIYLAADGYRDYRDQYGRLVDLRPLRQRLVEALGEAA